MIIVMLMICSSNEYDYHYDLTYNDEKWQHDCHYDPDDQDDLSDLEDHCHPNDSDNHGVSL